MANNTKNKKPNMFVRLGRFFKNSWGELKKVQWPTAKTVLKNTGIVLAVVVFFAVLVFGFDQLLTYLLITLPLGA